MKANYTLSGVDYKVARESNGDVLISVDGGSPTYLSPDEARLLASTLTLAATPDDPE